MTPRSYLPEFATSKAQSTRHGPRQGLALCAVVYTGSLRATQQEAREKTRSRTKKVNYSRKKAILYKGISLDAQQPYFSVRSSVCVLVLPTRRHPTHQVPVLVLHPTVERSQLFGHKLRDKETLVGCMPNVLGTRSRTLANQTPEGSGAKE